MAPVEDRNFRKYPMFSTVLAVCFALKILASFSRIYRLPKKYDLNKKNYSFQKKNEEANKS